MAERHPGDAFLNVSCFAPGGVERLRRGFIMLYVCFYTAGTLYEREAARLRASLDALGLDHYLVSIADKGSWKANAQFTAQFLIDMMELHGRPICYLDADAYVWKPPALLEAITQDIGVHYRKNVELLNGTLYLSGSDKCRATIRRYAELVAQNEHDRNEQKYLDVAIREVGPTVFRLPPSYCWIHDLMHEDIGDDQPVIEHLQASREIGSVALDRRRRRLQEIGHAYEDA